MKLNTKLVAGAVAASMLLPMAALAHDDRNGDDKGLRLGTFFGFGAKAQVDRDGDHNKADFKGWGKVHASSTKATSSVAVADAIERKGTRLVALADLMGSLSSNLAARIASSSLSASSTVEAQGNLNDYNTAVASAKAKAQAAVTLASTVGSTTASTTAAVTIGDARSALKEAKSFIKDAHREFMLIVRAIVNASVDL